MKLPNLIKEGAKGSFVFTHYINGKKTQERKSTFTVEKVRSKDFIIVTPKPTGATGSLRIFCDFPQEQKETIYKNGSLVIRQSQHVIVNQAGYTRTELDVYLNDKGLPEKQLALEASFNFLF